MLGAKSVVMGAPTAASKRSALGEIGNDPAACRGVVARKVGRNDVKACAPPRK